jgi:hypothetical protein
MAHVKTHFFLKPVHNLDESVKSQFCSFPVIPAKAGIQYFQKLLDPGLRRGDESGTFYGFINLMPQKEDVCKCLVCKKRYFIDNPFSFIHTCGSQ